MEVTYSYMNEEDIEDVAELEKQAFSQNWSKDGIKHYFDAGQTMFIVAKNDDKVIGFLAILCVLDEGNLVSITVDENFRRMGIASELLDVAFEEALKAGVKSINLEVRKSNEAAIKMYEEEGFVHVGTRKDFYKKPAEDALLYIKEL